MKLNMNYLVLSLCVLSLTQPLQASEKIETQQETPSQSSRLEKIKECFSFFSEHDVNVVDNRIQKLEGCLRQYYLNLHNSSDIFLIKPHSIDLKNASELGISSKLESGELQDSLIKYAQTHSNVISIVGSQTKCIGSIFGTNDKKNDLPKTKVQEMGNYVDEFYKNKDNKSKVILIKPNSVESQNTSEIITSLDPNDIQDSLSQYMDRTNSSAIGAPVLNLSISIFSDLIFKEFIREFVEYALPILEKSSLTDTEIKKLLEKNKIEFVNTKESQVIKCNKKNSTLHIWCTRLYYYHHSRP